MRHSHILAIGFTSIAALLTACQDDESSSTSSSGGPTTTTTTSTGGSGGTTTTTTTTTTGGNGGMGGTTSGNGGGGGMVNLPACTDMTQLLISEVQTGGTNAEFVEIWNPSSTAVDLTSYHLTDNSAYHQITGGSWTPMGTANTDYVVRFPAGTMIGANDVLVIEFGTDFEGSHTNDDCPDFTIRPGAMCNNAATPQMIAPSYGSAPNPGQAISGSGEMVMLFCFDRGNRVYDVDYLMYDPITGEADDLNTRVDKTNVTGYVADTNLATQVSVVAPLPGNNKSLARCDSTEDGETMTGGNGLLGHDETSEDFGSSFVVLDTPSPGAVNSCP
jgi:hypothetical protein